MRLNLAWCELACAVKAVLPCSCSCQQVGCLVHVVDERVGVPSGIIQVGATGDGPGFKSVALFACSECVEKACVDPCTASGQPLACQGPQCASTGCGPEEKRHVHNSRGRRDVPQASQASCAAVLTTMPAAQRLREVRGPHWKYGTVCLHWPCMLDIPRGKVG